jgi:hypothetical protein
MLSRAYPRAAGAEYLVTTKEAKRRPLTCSDVSTGSHLAVLCERKDGPREHLQRRSRLSTSHFTLDYLFDRWDGVRGVWAEDV